METNSQETAVGIKSHAGRGKCPVRKETDEVWDISFIYARSVINILKSIEYYTVQKSE